MPAATFSSRSSRILRALTIAALIGIPIALALVPLDLVNAGPTLCLYKRFTGADCMGCGMTRSMISLFHLELGAAYDFNRGIIGVAPLLIWLWVKELLRNVRLLSADLRLPAKAATARLTP